MWYHSWGQVRSAVAGLSVVAWHIASPPDRENGEDGFAAIPSFGRTITRRLAVRHPSPGGGGVRHPPGLCMGAVSPAESG